MDAVSIRVTRALRRRRRHRDQADVRDGEPFPISPPLSLPFLIFPASAT